MSEVDDSQSPIERKASQGLGFKSDAAGEIATLKGMLNPANNL